MSKQLDWEDFMNIILITERAMDMWYGYLETRGYQLEQVDEE